MLPRAARSAPDAPARTAACAWSRHPPPQLRRPARHGFLPAERPRLHARRAPADREHPGHDARLRERRAEAGSFAGHPSKVCFDYERGLLGLAVDPAFETNHYIYLYYTFKSRRLRDNTANAPVNRVSRFVLGDDNVIDPASEVVLIDNIPSPGGSHNAGDLQFGKDGYLYVSVGDGGCDYAGNSGCAERQRRFARPERPARARSCGSRATASIPPDNPFTGADSARCNLTGRDHARPEVPGDLRMGPAQPVPDRLRSERERDPLLHQRRRRVALGGDRPRRERRRLRLERARGTMRARLLHELRAASGRHDEPDLRLRPHQRMLLRHGGRVRAARACGPRSTTTPTCTATSSAATIFALKPTGGGYTLERVRHRPRA